MEAHVGAGAVSSVPRTTWLRLEPYEPRGSRTVLRGRDCGNAVPLPDVRPEGHRRPHHFGDPQGSMMECPVREPCPPKCCYPDMRRSNPTCEASGTTALLWKHQSGRGPAEDGRLNASERPWLRSVIVNRPKVLTGRGQNGMWVGSSIGPIDDGGTVTHRTIGRSLPIRISTLDNRVSPTRPATARWRYPYRKAGDGGGGRGESEKANAVS
jgi:hypothetical protein